MWSYRILLFLYILTAGAHLLGCPWSSCAQWSPAAISSWGCVLVPCFLTHSLEEPRALSILLENKEKQTCPFLGAGESRVGLPPPGAFPSVPFLPRVLEQWVPLVLAVLGMGAWQRCSFP